jgi:hypothetical protein
MFYDIFCLFPQQSEYLMMITLYFLLSIGWTLISMAWFMICNFYVSKGEMPQSLHDFSGYLQRGFFCCFPQPAKENNASTQKDVVVENGELKKSENQENTKSTNFPPLQRHNKVESINMDQHTIVGDMEPIPTNIELNEPVPVVSNNETNEKAKPKCNFCNRCKSCQTEFDKDKLKTKNKKENETRCNPLNYFVFVLVLLVMFLSNVILWSIMAQ